MLGERSDQRGLWEADRLYLDHVGKDTFYGLLASLRGRLFRDAEFCCLDNGRDSVPPSLLARLVQLGIRQARYFGRAKTKFQLYLAATVANLTLVGAKVGLPADTGGESSVGNALRTGAIRSALDFVPARLGQILTLVLLTSASLPKYIPLKKAFRPDF